MKHDPRRIFITDDTGNKVLNPDYDNESSGGILGKIKPWDEHSREETIEAVFKMVKFYYYGISRKDLKFESNKYFFRWRDMLLALDILIGNRRIKYKEPEPEYLDRRGYRNENHKVYTPTHRDKLTATEDNRAVPDKHTMKAVNIIIRLIAAHHGGIWERHLKEAYKLEHGSMWQYRDSIAWLLHSGKVKINDKPKTGKIKTIYSAT